MSKILVVDDEQMIRLAFAEFLKDAGHTPLPAEDGKAALLLLKQHNPEIIFLDYRLPGVDGLDILAEIKKTAPDAAVIFMTAFGAMDVAIKAMHLGAHEYLTKPLDLDMIREMIKRILAGKKTSAALTNQSGSAEIILEQMAGNSQAMQQIFKMIGLLSIQDVTVLITGESGVGKELVARAIHDNSPRRDHPFLAINCGALPENLLESELFGCEQGAFTGADFQRKGKFEAAGKGTLFLDEIGELKLSLQVKLLRVIQERTFERIGGTEPVRSEARIITATNKNLQEEMRSGRFRKDLFYRLDLVNINVPPLRRRLDDIPLLVKHFISKVNKEQDSRVLGIADEVLEELSRYAWPGNVRELENRIRRAMALTRENILTADLFELAEPEPFSPDSATTSLISSARSLFLEMAEHNSNMPLLEHIVQLVEKTIIAESLKKCNNNQVHAARLLTIHRSTLRKKIKDYNIGDNNHAFPEK